MGVGVNCQGNAVNAGEFQRNEWEWVNSARRMQETTRVMQGSGCKCERNEGVCRGLPGEGTRVEAKCEGNARECRGIQGNARGTYGSGCKVPGECWGMQGNARGKYGSGCKLPGECRGMPGEHMGVGV